MQLKEAGQINLYDKIDEEITQQKMKQVAIRYSSIRMCFSHSYVYILKIVKTVKRNNLFICSLVFLWICWILICRMEKEQEENTIFDNRILKIIQHIKSNWNRAGYQNIQSFLNRIEPKLDMDKLKVRLGELEEQGIIINKVRGEVESFSIIKQDSASGDTAKEEDGDDDLCDLKSFLDDSFYNVLINRIKLEVNNALLEINVIKSDDELRVINIPNDTNEETKLKDEVVSLKKVLECKDKTNESLLKSLYEEIAFLRNEITSKDTIIKMLEERVIKGNKNNGQNLEKVKFNDDVNSNKEINADEKSRQNNNSTTSYT